MRTFTCLLIHITPDKRTWRPKLDLTTTKQLPRYSASFPKTRLLDGNNHSRNEAYHALLEEYVTTADILLCDGLD